MLASLCIGVSLTYSAWPGKFQNLTARQSRTTHPKSWTMRLGCEMLMQVYAPEKMSSYVKLAFKDDVQILSSLLLGGST